MGDTVIAVQSVGKKFSRTIKHVMTYGALDITRDFFGIKTNTGNLRSGEFWAVDDVSFEVKRGETIGIIGQNGSGKSTLLKMLNGIFMPDRGRIAIRGRVAALIEVGAGFHPMLTGRENIYVNGQILGMSKREIDKKFDSIVDFADIGDFLDSPVKHYSSGMYVRLGFAVAIHSDPEILLVDEVLAVGDVGFQLKCFNKIGELKDNNVSIVLVSHDLHNMSTYSNKILVMNNGKQEHFGDVSRGISIYKEHFSSLFKSQGEIEKVSINNEELSILNVNFNPQLEDNLLKIQNHESVRVTINYEATRDFDDVDIDTVIYLPIPGPHFFQATNRVFEKRVDLKKGRGSLTIKVNDLTLNNIQGDITIAIWEKDRKSILFWWRRIPIEVKGPPKSTGWSHFVVEYEVK